MYDTFLSELLTVMSKDMNFYMHYLLGYICDLLSTFCMEFFLSLC